MPASRSDWERVGPMLVDRRIEISARYANRRAFAADVGINWRLLYDAEHGKRATFKPENVRAFETAYRLVPGSLERTLAGGPLEPRLEPQADPVPLRPVPAPVTAASEAEDVLARLLAGHWDDEVVQAIGTPVGPQARKPAYEVVGEVLRWLERQGDRGAAEAERARLVAAHPDDEVLQVINRQSGKKSWMVAVEMLDWLATQGPAVPQARRGTAG